MSLKTIGVAAAAIFFVLTLLHWGDRYGSNAQKLAELVSKQAAKNGKLTQQAEDDGPAHAAEWAHWQSQANEFDAAQPSLKQCPQDQAELNALNALIGDD